MYDEFGNYLGEEDKVTLADVIGGAATSTGLFAAGVGAVSAERARRLNNQTGQGYKKSLAQVLSDLREDFEGASRVAYGTTPFDYKQEDLQASRAA